MKINKLKIGDKVIINKKKCEFFINYTGTLPMWYSNEIYIIKEINFDKRFVYLDRNLLDIKQNIISVKYLTLLKKNRRKKLLNLPKEI